MELVRHFIHSHMFDEAKGKRLDLKKSYTVVFAPIASKWFQFLQNNIVLKGPIQTLCARVAMDQILFAPTAISMFFVATSAMEGKDPSLQVQEKLLPTYKMNLILWPWVQLVNFTLIPLHYRLLFVNTVNIGISVLLILFLTRLLIYEV
jgi:protein Mpv17